jgi:hypothetical protein
MTTLLPQVQRKSTEGRLGRLKNTMGIRTGDYTPDDRSNRRGPANGHDEYDVFLLLELVYVVLQS